VKSYSSGSSFIFVKTTQKYLTLFINQTKMNVEAAGCIYIV